MFDEAFAAIGSRSIAFDRIVAEAGGQPGVDLYAAGHPFDRLRIPTLHGVGWFDNITPPHMLDYERLMRDPEAAPHQYLHAGSTDHENYQFEAVPIPESLDHDTHDDALEVMLPRYLGPRARVLRRIPRHPRRPRGGAPRPLAPRKRGLAQLAVVAAPRGEGTHPPPRRLRGAAPGPGRRRRGRLGT